MIYGKDDLLGGEPDINSVQHSTKHRYCIETFEIAVTVPVHHGNGITWLDPQFR